MCSPPPRSGVSLSLLSVRPHISASSSPPLSSLRSHLIHSSRPAGAFQQVNSQSGDETLPPPPPPLRLSSGCKHQRGGGKLRWGRFVKVFNAVKSPKKPCSILSSERNYVFLSPRPPHTQPTVRVWMGFLKLAFMAQTSRAAALEDRRKELKSQRYWRRKAARRFVALFSAWINLSSIDGKSYGRRWKRGERKRT